MLSLSRSEIAWPTMAMADIPNDTPENRRRLGRALALLRDDAGLTQPMAADALNITVQAWQNYEYGRRRFTRDLIERVTRALKREPDDLVELFERLPSNDDLPPTASRRSIFELPLLGRVRAGPRGIHIFDPGGEPEFVDFAEYFTGDWRVLQLGGESMIPYAEPGGFVTYNEKRWPQRNKGCVIETNGGDYFVKRYDGVRDDVLHVTELHPQEREITFPMDEVKGVYAVGLRLD